MGIRFKGRLSTTSRTGQETFLQKKRLKHILYRIPIFPERRGEGLNANWTAVESINDDIQQSTIHLIEPGFIYLKQRQCALGRRTINHTVRTLLCVIAHPF
jgi:hypothetical protein